jgi:hypothetical protein
LMEEIASLHPHFVTQEFGAVQETVILLILKNPWIQQKGCWE